MAARREAGEDTSCTVADKIIANPRQRVWDNWLFVPLAILGVAVLAVLLWIYLFISIFPWPSLMPGTPLSPMHEAALRGDIVRIQAELDTGVLVDLPTLAMESWVDGATPLMLAAYRRQSDAVKLLIASGADVAAIDARGGTSLHWAIYATYWDGIGILVDAGANIDARDKRGQTPLLHVALGGEASLLAALIDEGADPHATDDLGRTALDLVRRLAPTRRDNIEVLEAAMGRNRDPETRK